MIQNRVTHNGKATNELSQVRRNRFFIDLGYFSKVVLFNHFSLEEKIKCIPYFYQLLVLCDYVTYTLL